jgi:hypothetical protein
MWFFIYHYYKLSLLQKQLVGLLRFFSRGGLKSKPLLLYYSIWPAPVKAFLEAGDAITRPWKWGSFLGAGDGALFDRLFDVYDDADCNDEDVGGCYDDGVDGRPIDGGSDDSSGRT